MNKYFRGLGLSLSLITGLVACRSTAGDAQEAREANLVRTGSIQNRRMREASGVAASRVYPGIFWTHNDSGDGPFLFAMDVEGRLLASFDVRGARSRDWEDIALGPCPTTQASCLYIADTGDNQRERGSVSIYIVPEPDPSAGAPDSVVKTASAQRIRVRYGDGHKYDVEAMAVAPDGSITLVSKGRRRRSGIMEFRISAAEVGEEEVQARVIGPLPITPMRQIGRWVTGAAISPTGERLVVRTYTELYFFSRSPDGRLQQTPMVCWLGAAEPQGEAVDFLDENRVLLVSEGVGGRAGTIYEASCPEQ